MSNVKHITFNFSSSSQKVVENGPECVYDSLTIAVSSGDDFFDDEFNNEFDKMEKEDKFHNKLEDGFKNWEERYVTFTFNSMDFARSYPRKICKTVVIQLFSGVWRMVENKCWQIT